MTDHANMLRQAAAEMRHYGHDGWPNVCDWGADELDRLNAQALELCAEISGLRRENESMRHDLGVLRGHHHEGCMAEIERLRGLLTRVHGIAAEPRPVNMAVRLENIACIASVRRCDAPGCDHWERHGKACETCAT